MYRRQIMDRTRSDHRETVMPTTITNILETVTAGAADDRSLAVGLHDVVRDRIAFGFTPWFDDATAEQTLRLGVGHCNPQAALFVALLRSAGLTARFQPVTITNDVLRGFLQTPPLLSHVFTELRLDGTDDWIRLDSYIVDPPLRAAAVARLTAEGRTLGYGCHVDASSGWNGTDDAFSQIVTDDLVEAWHEPVDDLADFYRSGAYRHRVGPIRFTTLMTPMRLLGRRTTASMCRDVDKVRSSHLSR
jgi:transglutaminase-like putative cysteine protease